jgi:fluoroquinolone transport system permease protein
MNANAWFQVFRADLRRVLRDRFLLLIVTYLPFMAYAVFRAGLPKLSVYLKSRFDLTQYYPPIYMTLIVILPYMFGYVLGLQLLEDKDENSLSAVAVTPFSIERYFFFRAATYGTIGALIMVVTHQIIGVITTVSLWQLLLVALVLIPNAALSALLLSILAKNQVEGFAVMKGSGMLFVGPALSFFVPQHWDLLFGIVPFYWPIKAYYVAYAQGPAWLFFVCLVVGLVYQIGVIALMYKRFKRVVF